LYHDFEVDIQRHPWCYSCAGASTPQNNDDLVFEAYVPRSTESLELQEVIKAQLEDSEFDDGLCKLCMQRQVVLKKTVNRVPRFLVVALRRRTRTASNRYVKLVNPINCAESFPWSDKIWTPCGIILHSNKKTLISDEDDPESYSGTRGHYSTARLHTNDQNVKQTSSMNDDHCFPRSPRWLLGHARKTVMVLLVHATTISIPPQQVAANMLPIEIEAPFTAPTSKAACPIAPTYEFGHQNQQPSPPPNPPTTKPPMQSGALEFLESIVPEKASPSWANIAANRANTTAPVVYSMATAIAVPAPTTATAAPSTAPTRTTAAPSTDPTATTAAPSTAPTTTTAAPSTDPTATTAAPSTAPTTTTTAPSTAPTTTTAALEPKPELEPKPAPKPRKKTKQNKAKPKVAKVDTHTNVTSTAEPGSLSAAEYNNNAASQPANHCIAVDGRFRICTFNVHSLRNLVKRSKTEAFNETFDVLVLTEIKSSLEKLRQIPLLWNRIAQYHYCFWSICEYSSGYAGTCVLTQRPPLSVKFGFNDDGPPEIEGRLVTVRFTDATIVGTYAPTDWNRVIQESKKARIRCKARTSPQRRSPNSANLSRWRPEHSSHCARSDRCATVDPAWPKTMSSRRLH
jgi:hypothetical protein